MWSWYMKRCSHGTGRGVVIVQEGVWSWYRKGCGHDIGRGVVVMQEGCDHEWVTHV